MLITHSKTYVTSGNLFIILKLNNSLLSRVITVGGSWLMAQGSWLMPQGGSRLRAKINSALGPGPGDPAPIFPWA